MCALQLVCVRVVQPVVSDRMVQESYGDPAVEIVTDPRRYFVGTKNMASAWTVNVHGHYQRPNEVEQSHRVAAEYETVRNSMGCGRLAEAHQSEQSGHDASTAHCSTRARLK